jgi:hypothetical protein
VADQPPIDSQQPPIDPLAILDVLARHRVRYVLIGGVAANIHGYPLPTEDVDITPDPDDANYRRLARALAEMRARLRTGKDPDGVEFDVSAEALRRAAVWKLVTDLGDLDVVTEPAGTAGYRDLRRDAVEIELGPTLRVAVASLPDLTRSKEASGRPKDIAALPALRATLERLERGGAQE